MSLQASTHHHSFVAANQETTTPLRSDLIKRLANQFQAVLSKRAGVSLAIWGDNGLGKSWTAQQLLTRIPCLHNTIHAAAQGESIAQLVTDWQQLPIQSQQVLKHLRAGELDPKLSADALVTGLRILAPFILHLDDLHEAEPEQLTFWCRLAEGIHRSPGLGLIATSHHPPPKPFHSIQLTPFSQDETALLLNSTLDTNLPEMAITWILHRTRGNPLYSLEYLRFLCRQGFLYSDGNHWHWRQPPAQLIPYSIEDLVMQQVENLSQTAEMRAVIEARAVFIYEVSRPIWAAVADVSLETLEACRKRIVQSGLMKGNSYAHPLFCQAIRQTMPQHRKQALARRVIELIAEDNPLLAAQYIAAARLLPEEAIVLLERARAEASRCGLQSDATLLFAKRAELETGSERISLLLAATERLRAISPLEALRLARLAAKCTPTNEAALALYANLLLNDGQWEAAAALLEQHPEASWKDTDYLLLQLRIIAQSFRVRETRHFWLIHPELHARAPATTQVEVALALIDCGDFDAAEALLSMVLDTPKLAPEDRGFTLDAWARLLYLRGKYAAAQQAAADAIAILETAPQPRRLAQVLGVHSLACWIQGDYATANADLQRSLITFRQTEDGRGVNCWQSVLGFFKTEQGAYDEAEHLLQDCRKRLIQEPPSPQLARTEALLGLLYLIWNPPLAQHLALRHTHATLQLVRQLDIPTLYTELLPFCARVEAMHGDASTALTLAHEALERAASLSQSEPVAAAQAACGVACAQLGRQDEAVSYLRSAMTAYDKLGLTIRAEFVGLDLDILLADTTSAAQRLATFETLGITTGAEAIRRSFPNLQSNPHTSTQAALRLEVLGAFTLWRGNHTVNYHARKGEELLAYLLESRLAGRHDVPGLELRDALYPHLPDEEGRTALKQLVYRLRSSLGREIIMTTSTGYALGKVETDVETFIATHNTHLWHGPYLASLGGGWNASVSEMLCHKLFELASKQLETNPLEAARLGRILLETNPYHQAALTLTLHALQTTGQHQSCAQLYRKAQRTFSDIGEVLPAAYQAFLEENAL